MIRWLAYTAVVIAPAAPAACKLEPTAPTNMTVDYKQPSLTTLADMPAYTEIDVSVSSLGAREYYGATTYRGVALSTLGGRYNTHPLADLNKGWGPYVINNMKRHWATRGMFQGYTSHSVSGPFHESIVGLLDEAIPAGSIVYVPGATKTMHLRGVPTAISTDSDEMCSRLASSGPGMYLNTEGLYEVSLSYKSTYVGSHYLEYYSWVPVRLVNYTEVSATPTRVDFGRLSTGTSGSQPVMVTVKAISDAKHTITFTYTSDNNTREILTVNNNSLPYTATRTIPSGQSSRTEEFDVRITSSTAAEVRGRLQITAQVT